MMKLHFSAMRAVLTVLLIGCGLFGLFVPRPASAESSATFQSTANPGGGTILTGTLGSSSLPTATATLMRRLHAELGARPTIVQVALDNRDRTLALLFIAKPGGTQYTGVAIVTANAGAQAGGAALYDTTARFHTTVGPMMRRLQGMTVAAGASGGSARTSLAPAEPLIPHPFADGTGSISIPAGWMLNAGGGSAMANAPSGGAQVSYNMHFTGIDPSNPRAQMFLRTATPLARENLHGAVLPYTGDPVASWIAMYKALAQQRGMQAEIHVSSSTPAGQSAADFAGTLGSGAKTVHFIAHVFLLPPNPNGLWSLSDNHIFVSDGQVARLAETANAVLDSVRINFGAVAAQEDAIRQSFQRMFEADIANDRAQDAARQERTDEALASDRAAQEGMHKQAVAMENYSLDRAVVVNTVTGVHSTVDSNFAGTLVQENPNYQQVPAADLLRGVDY
ncbi:MAG TPA: hypothetical protein VFE16_04435 [Candidatus Cybelea sp.]|jgi:hypothetical protein|nr:hypothetical protein [Candidatus Cybelea sp.]